MSLDLESKWAGNRAPGMDIAYRLVYAVAIFASSQAIVLEVIDGFEPEHSLE
jgi:hypothetical protein